MNRALTAVLSFCFVVGFLSVSAASGGTSQLDTKHMLAASGQQPYFRGIWRCNNGSNLSVMPGIGPWYVWQHKNGPNEERSFVYNELDNGAWFKLGVDSAGHHWNMSSPGWSGDQLTFTGTYHGKGGTVSQRQTYRKDGERHFQATTWRSGTIAIQYSCDKE